MYHALDLGVSWSDFWEMSPRAIFTLQRELARSIERQKGKGTGPKKLSYIPR